MPSAARPSGRRARRAPLRALAALLLALVLAACQGAGNPSTAATIGDETISVEQVEEQFQAVAATDQFAAQLEGDQTGEAERSLQAQVLTELLRSELLRLAADDLGVEPVSEEDVQAEREALAEQFGGEEALTQQIESSGLSEEDVTRQLRDRVLQQRVTAEVAPEVDEADVQAVFESDYGEQRAVRHILVEEEQQAQDAIERIEGGEDFADVAADLSTDPGSAEQGGDLGQVARGTTVEPFEEAAFSAEVGELVGPVETEFGYHVLEVTEVVAGPELEEVAEDIRTQLTQQQGGQAFNEYVADLLERIEVEVNPRFGEWDDATVAVVPEQPLGDPSEAASGDPAAPAGDPAAPAEGATEVAPE